MKIRHAAIAILFISIPHLVNAQRIDLANPSQWDQLSLVQKENVLAQEFAAYPAYYAAARGYQFGPGATQFFDFSFGRRIANEVLTRGPDDFTKTKQEAKQNIELLIDTMIKAAHSIPDYSENNPGVIGEDTLSSALASLCPLWPICS